MGFFCFSIFFYYICRIFINVMSKLNENLFRIKEIMGVISEQEVDNQPYTYQSRVVGDKWMTFKNLDRKFSPEPNTTVTLQGPNGTFTYEAGKNIFKSGFRDNEAYVSKVSNDNTKNPFTPHFIRNVIKNTFPENWNEETNEFSAGLRNVFPFSETDSWSVLNYFDTNPHRQSKLYEYFLGSGETDAQKWFSEFLKSNDPRLEKLIQQQRDAILRADDVEKNSMDLISNNYMTYPKGHKIDRYSGIDAVDLNDDKTYQIKTVKDVQEMVDTETGEIFWKVIGDKSRIKDYKDKSQLNKLGYFVKDKGVLYVFDNKNYKVISTDEVHHFSEPNIF